MSRQSDRQNRRRQSDRQNRRRQPDRQNGRGLGIRLARVPLVWALVSLLVFSVFPAYAFADVRESDLIDGQSLSVWSAQGQAITDAPNLNADFAAVCTSDGRILYARDPDGTCPMASTTKIMTAILALEYLPLDYICTVTTLAATTGGTSAGLKAGEQLTFGDLLVALLLPSGNDAAVCIAENAAGSVIAFVDLMNAKAEQLGMTNTHFRDPSGLEEVDHYTSVRDYLILVRYAMRNPIFAEIVGRTEMTVSFGGQEHHYVNTNKLFYMMDGVLGIKTGTNYESDACLAAAAELHGIRIYTMILHSDTDTTRYWDTLNLMDFAYAHYRKIELVNTRVEIASMALTSWTDRTVSVRVPYPVNAYIFDYAGPITVEVEVADWDGSIAKGEVVGRIIWSQGGEVLASAELVSAEAVAAPDFWEGLVVAWNRFWAPEGVPDHLTTTILVEDTIPVEIRTSTEYDLPDSPLQEAA